jgi:hypothetical protein
MVGKGKGGAYGRGLCGARVGLRSNDDQRCGESAIVPETADRVACCYRHRETRGDGSGFPGWTNACACNERSLCSAHAGAAT